MFRRDVVPAALALLFLLTCPVLAADATPHLRTVTAFVRIDRTNYRQQIGEALGLLRKARAAFEAAGYEVQTVRITTQPFPEYTRDLTPDQALAFLQELDGIAAKEQFALNIGPALQGKNDSQDSVELLGRFLIHAKNTNASMFVAGDDGVHWPAVRSAAHLVKYLSEHSDRSQATFSFAATAMLPPYAPFYPGAYHNGPGKKFAVGFEAAGVVERVFATSDKDPEHLVSALTEQLAIHAKAAERIGRELQAATGWEFLGIDTTPAPLGDVSIAGAMEHWAGKFGASGTLTSAALITQAVKAVPVKQVGYSGLMVPVLEDARLAQRWAEGTYDLDSLLSYSAVCGTGLDAVPMPGDVTEEQLARIIGDVATLAVKWKKPLTARLQPVAGKKAGDKTDFDGPYLFNTVLQPLK
jgi:uncharacterized protein (UPF0210 family)